MLAPNASTDSGDVPSENIVGSSASDERLRRQIGQGKRLPKALLSDAGRQRAGPSGVRGSQYQRPRDRGVSVAELERKCAAER
jgi:hypothetical protein